MKAKTNVRAVRPALKILLLAGFCAALSSCFLRRPPRPSQALEGNVIPIGDSSSGLLGLKCSLMTGEPINGGGRAPWTHAEDVKIEKKISKGIYKPLGENGSLVYKRASYREEPQEGAPSVYRDSSDPSGKKPVYRSDKDYINDFRLVRVASIRDKAKNRFLSPKSGPAAEGLSCAALLSPDELPSIYAKASHTYDVRFQIFGSYLRALLVAPAEDLPFHALPYSIKVRSGKDIYAMPLGGYSAQAGALTETENADFEATRVLTFLPMPAVAKSGLQARPVDGIPSVYIRSCSGCAKAAAGCPRICVEKPHLRPSHIQLAGEFASFKDLRSKTDAYPKRLFEGEWHYVRTGVSENIQRRAWGFKGMQQHASMDTKIKVEFRKNHLVGYSLNTESANTGRGGEGIHASRPIFSIPVEHADYHFPDLRDQIARKAALAEIENNDKAYQAKPFVKIDFSKIKLHKDRWANRLFLDYQNFGDTTELFELTFSEDYFSFVLEQGDKTKLRFSFLRPERDSSYEPLYLSERGWDLFPAFWIDKRVEQEDRATYSEDWRKSRLIMRLHIRPDKPVIYRFTSLTPKDEDDCPGSQGKKACLPIRDIGREVINLWNQVFEKADIPCPEEGCFALKEDYDAELGDPRYHAQNFISPDEVNRGGGGGLGPSIADFETGEILSATSNNYTEGVFSASKSRVYSYIMAKMGLDPSFRRMHFQTAWNPEEGRSRGGMADLLERHLSGSLMGLPVSKSFLDWIAAGRSAAGLQSLFNTSFRPDALLFGFDFNNKAGELQPLTVDEGELDRKYEELFGKPPAEDFSVQDKYKKISEGGGHAFGCAAGAFAGMDGAGPVFSPGGRLSKMSSAIYHLIDEICDLRIFYENGGQSERDIRSEVLLEKSPHEKLEWLRDEVSSLERAARDSIIDECARKIYPILALDTAIHETGHNLPMLHNFAGTYDKRNFLKPFEDFEHKFIFNHLTANERGKMRLLDVASAPASSTAMDYAGPQRLVLAPGGYDVGFARFIYGSQLEGPALEEEAVSESGEAVYQESAEIFTVDPYSLTRAGADGSFEKVNDGDLRPYRRCWERSIFYNKDPYCQQGDMGVSAAEIAQNHYNYHVGENDSPFGFFIAMLPLYHEWRARLKDHLNSGRDTGYLTDFGAEYYLDSAEGPSPSFLSDFNLERHKGALGNICALTGETGEISPIADLCAARDILFNGLFDYLFHEKDHYCLLKHGYSDNIQRLVSFRDLQTAAADERDYSSGGWYSSPGPFSSCYDLEGMSPITWKIAGEFGRPLFDVEYASGRNNYTTLGRKGSIEGRLLSGLAFLLPHLRPNFADRSSDFLPLRLLDEPDARARIVEALASRLADGESFKSGAAYAEKTPETSQQPAKITKKSLDETVQTGALNTRNFSSEQLLWRWLAPPLFMHSMPNPYAYKGFTIQLALNNLARMGPLQPFNPRLLVQMQRILLDQPALYIEGGSKELSAEEAAAAPIFIEPFPSGSSHVFDLINSLKKNDWTKSSLKLARKFREVIQDENESIFSNTYKQAGDNKTCISEPFDCQIGQFRSFIQDTGHAMSALLAHPRPYVNALAVSLVYDYLEKGEFIEGPDGLPRRPQVFISDFFASFLQNGWALHFEMSLAFKEKCRDDGIPEEGCARTRLLPYLQAAMDKREDLAAFDAIIRDKLKGGGKADAAGPESFMDKAVYRLDSGREEKGAPMEELELWEYNPFKPRLELLVEYFKENPEELVKRRRLIFDLNAMEAFRSEKHENSEVRAALRGLFSELKALADSLPELMRQQILEEIGIEEKTIGAIQAAIAHVRNLRHFPNSHALQLIFVRDLRRKSTIEAAKISSLDDQIPDISEGGGTLEEEVYEFLSLKNPVTFTLLQMQKADVSVPPIFHVDELDQASINLFKDVQSRANRASAEIHFHFDYEDTKRLFREYQKRFKGGWLRYSQAERLGLKIEDSEEPWFKDWLHLADSPADQKKPGGGAAMLNPLLPSPVQPTPLSALLHNAWPLFYDNYEWGSEKEEQKVSVSERTVDRLLLKELDSQRLLIINAIAGRFFYDGGSGYSEPVGLSDMPLLGERDLADLVTQGCERRKGCLLSLPAVRKWLDSAPKNSLSIKK